MIKAFLFFSALFLMADFSMAACRSRAQAEVYCSTPSYFVSLQTARCSYYANNVGSFSVLTHILPLSYNNGYPVYCSSGSVWVNRGYESYENCVVKAIGICEIDSRPAPSGGAQ